jgi:AcrR family transcriptional regulator
MSRTFARPTKTQSTASGGLSDSGRPDERVQDGPGADRAVAGRPDRRVARTHRALREALIALIRERGWDDVTVQDVCERADVGRSTFYVHFADKEELLVTGFADLRRNLRALVAGGDGEPLGFTMALIEHAGEYKELFKALVGRRTAAKVQREFMEVVKELVAEDLIRAGVPAGSVPEVAVVYVAGAFWEIIVWWFEQRRLQPADELAAAFKRMTLPVLQTVQRQSSGSGRRLR